MLDVEAVHARIDNTVLKDSPKASSLSCSDDEHTQVRKTQATNQVSDPSKLSFLARIEKTAERKRLLQQPEGKILRNRFSLLKTLGSGGMGDVYLAKDLLREEMEDSAPFVAIKLLNEECQNQEGALQALQREAKKAQSLSHPNIVTVFDFDRCGDIAFISMEYLEGQTLKEYLFDNGTMGYAKAMQIVERVARGLAYAHQKGFVHADIKPANIFLLKDGSVKILDLGIARAINATQESLTPGDALTAFALTPNYATISSLQGQPVSARDDVYALACVAYQLLTGRHPYTSYHGLPLTSLEAKESGVKVEGILGLKMHHMRALRKALRLDSENSFANAGEFIDAIKPSNHKKTFSSLIGAGAVAITCWVALQSFLNARVPSLDQLPIELANVAYLVKEGDRSLASEDIDLAHRLYSQAWFNAQTHVANKKIHNIELVRSIIQSRTNSVVVELLKQAKQKELSEFEIREYLGALEIFSNNEFVTRPHKIRKAIADLKLRLNP